MPALQMLERLLIKLVAFATMSVGDVEEFVLSKITEEISLKEQSADISVPYL